MNRQFSSKSNPNSKVLKITKFGHEQEEILNICKKTPWVNELLNELEANNDDIKFDNPKYPNKCDIKLTILRKNSKTLKDHLIIQGNIDCQYTTLCVRCLDPALQTIQTYFSCCFVHPAMKFTAEYEGKTEVFCEGQEMELYFHDNGSIDLYELLHEQIFLAVEPFPLHSKECKGLCSSCGANLNKTKCQCK